MLLMERAKSISEEGTTENEEDGQYIPEWEQTEKAKKEEERRNESTRLKHEQEQEFAISQEAASETYRWEARCYNHITGQVPELDLSKVG